MKQVELKIVKSEDLNDESIAEIAAQAFIPTCTFTKRESVGLRCIPVEYVLFFRIGDERETLEGGESIGRETPIPKRRGRPPKNRIEEQDY
jgi:hypothetical protein